MSPPLIELLYIYSVSVDRNNPKKTGYMVNVCNPFMQQQL